MILLLNTEATPPTITKILDSTLSIGTLIGDPTPSFENILDSTLSLRRMSSPPVYSERSALILNTNNSIRDISTISVDGRSKSRSYS